MIIDQGIIIEYYLDDAYADECKRILEDLIDGTIDGYLSDFHLHGVVAIFNTYFKADAPDEIQDLIFSITSAAGLALHQLSFRDQIQICEIQRESVLDFDDATLVHLSDVLDAGEIITLDGDLDDYTGEIEYECLHPTDY
jgi:predicted nucleic acid-binding protein